MLASHPETVVTWTTKSVTSKSIVKYGKEGYSLDNSANGNITKFIDNNKVIRYIHRVAMTNLKPNTRYSKYLLKRATLLFTPLVTFKIPKAYQCGSNDGWSDKISFKTLSGSTNWSPKMLVFGDFGYVNAVSFKAIKQEVDNKNVDLLFHNGIYFLKNKYYE